MIKVRAELYSRLKEIVDASVIELSLPENATVNDLFEQLQKRYPELRGFERSVLFGILGLLLFCSHSPAARSEVDLGGTWQFQKVSRLTYPPTNTWQTMTVPGYLTGWNYDEKLLNIPARHPKMCLPDGLEFL